MPLTSHVFEISLTWYKEPKKCVVNRICGGPRGWEKMYSWLVLFSQIHFAECLLSVSSHFQGFQAENLLFFFYFSSSSFFLNRTYLNRVKNRGLTAVKWMGSLLKWRVRTGEDCCEVGGKYVCKWKIIGFTFKPFAGTLARASWRRRQRWQSARGPSLPRVMSAQGHSYSLWKVCGKHSRWCRFTGDSKSLPTRVLEYLSFCRSCKTFLDWWEMLRSWIDNTHAF